MADLHSRLMQGFAQVFGGVPDLVTRAPGRVNLIGEHTDYNGGFVLPAAISVETQVAIRARADAVVRIVAIDLDGAETAFALDAPIAPSADAAWSNYVRGVAHGLLAAGMMLGGADLAIAGSVPQGAGLSSSASLEVACGLAFAALTCLPQIDRTLLAEIGQAAEHQFAGCQCGIMDQLVSARASAGAALLIDCRSLETRPVALPQSHALMIIHSGVSRGLVDGAYNERRAQCDAAARYFGVDQLRDLEASFPDDCPPSLDPLAFRRARHVVSENRRVLAMVDALDKGDVTALPALMAQSHTSMRDDFEITVPAIDALVDFVQTAGGPEAAVRMTGGGFGGAIVALVPQDRVGPIERALEKDWRTPAGTPPLVMIETLCAGASLIG